MGFDLEEKDWVAPYGKGKKTDLYWEIKGKMLNKRDWDYSVTMSFPPNWIKMGKL